MEITPINRSQRRPTSYAATAVLLAIAMAWPCATTVAMEIAVEAGEHTRQGTLVTLPMPNDWPAAAQLQLTRVDDGRALPVQVVAEDGATVWHLDKTLVKGATRRYRLAKVKAREAKVPAVVVNDNGKALVITVHGKPVLHYNHAVVPSPIKGAPHFARSGYIHPVFNPSGQQVTGDFPADHPHQHAIMMPWTKTFYERKQVDFWNQAKRTGNVEHAKVLSTFSGNVMGGFTAELHHVKLTPKRKTIAGGKDLKAGDLINAVKKTALLRETWSVRVHAVSSDGRSTSAVNGYVFDIVSIQQGATDKPLTIAKYHYGGMAIRGPESWLTPDDKVKPNKAGPGGDFLTSERRTRLGGNHTRPDWVDIHGPMAPMAKADGKGKTPDHAGITVFSHPKNFRHPQPVRLHPSKPYFCFSPQVLGEFKIEKGKPYVSRYRFYVHDGKLDVKQAERLWQDYAMPVVVKAKS